MDYLILNLQYRIAALEAQLTTERQKCVQNEKTVIYLSGLLAEQAQAKQESALQIAPKPTSVKVEELADYPALQPKRIVKAIQKNNAHEGLGFAEQDDQKLAGLTKVSDVTINTDSALIEFDFSSPAKTGSKLRGIAPDFVSTRNVNEQIKHASNGNEAVSSATTSFSTLVDQPPVNNGTSDQPAKIDCKPPALDLNFKGLRTVHDGPEKTSEAEQNNPHQSNRTLSFEEAVGLTTVKHITTEESDKSTDTKEAVQPVQIPAKIRGIPQATLESINEKIGNFAHSKSYRKSPPARKSNAYSNSDSNHSNDYFRTPLSIFHGIHYTPKEDDLFLNRTRVMVLNLPLKSAPIDILARIRGGTVVSFQLLDTKFAYNTQSAIIRFSSYVEAMRCVDYSVTKPIVINGQAISIQLIPTPSYPLAPEIYKNIFEGGHTRCLRIYEFTRRVPYYIRKQYMDANYIEYEAKNGCGDWFVRFTSVARASALWAELEALKIPKSGGNGFMPDPCDNEGSDEFKVWKANDIKVMDIGTLKWKD